MPYDPDLHHRRSIRLPGYDYRAHGAYFITLVSVDRDCLFGSIVDGAVTLSPFGNVVDETWQWMSRQYPYLDLGEWVVMPNHFHAILWINELTATAGKLKIKPLGSLVGAFKTVTTKQINTLRGSSTHTIWQRNYYEHIIRDDHAFEIIRNYIMTNPEQWEKDPENPLRAGQE